MAQKRMKEHSTDLRELVIKHGLKGDIEREIADHNFLLEDNCLNHSNLLCTNGSSMVEL